MIEGSFWGANLLKVIHGGWFPLVVGLVIFTVMTTWHKGRQILSERMLEIISPLSDFLHAIRTTPPYRVPGIAVYMSGHPQYTPPTLAKSFKHFKCIHEHLIILFVQTVDIPHVPESNRVRFQNIGPHVYKVVIQYGFMDLPNVPNAMNGLQLDGGIVFDAENSTFFLGREHIIATKREGMALWREKLFATMSRNAQPATHFFQIPRNRVFEIGSMIDL